MKGSIWGSFEHKASQEASGCLSPWSHRLCEGPSGDVAMGTERPHREAYPGLRVQSFHWDTNTYGWPHHSGPLLQPPWGLEPQSPHSTAIIRLSGGTQGVPRSTKPLSRQGIPRAYSSPRSWGQRKLIGQLVLSAAETGPASRSWSVVGWPSYHRLLLAGPFDPDTLQIAVFSPSRTKCEAGKWLLSVALERHRIFLWG